METDASAAGVPGRRRLLAGAAVSLLGVVLLGVPLYDVWDDVTNLGWHPAVTIAENAVLFVLALWLVAGGVWLAFGDWRPAPATTVATWTVGGALAVAGLYAVVVAVQERVMGHPKPLVLALDGILFGAVATFAAGLYSARRQRSVTELERRERRLQELREALALPDATFDERLGRLLAFGRDVLDADVAAFVPASDATGDGSEPEVDADEAVVRAAPDAPAPDPGDLPTVDDWSADDADVATFTADDADVATFTADGDAYVGTVVAAGDDERLLCFRADPENHDAWALAVVELLGNWLAHELGRKRRLERQSERLREQAAHLDSVVEAVEEYAVVPLDADGHVAAWNEGAARTLGHDREAVVGEPLGALVPDDSEIDADDLLARAAEQGAASAAGEVAGADERFWADVTVSAHGGDRTAYTLVVHDLRDRRAYERQIERERERLEFVTRMLRHKLLNGMNVVHGRSEQLRPLVREHGDAEDRAHLSSVQERVADMAEFLDTMDAVLDALNQDADHELRPVSLREALEREVRRARDAYDADVEVRDLPDEDVRVVADDLLDELLENVVSNAVQHNDRDRPRVEIWTSEATLPASSTPGDRAGGSGEPLASHPAPDGDDADAPEAAVLASGDPESLDRRPAVTVHVADDGPGISDDRKREVLDKGLSGLSDPGSGFGLWLVRELVGTYGGEVAIRDNEPRGTVVELTLPRAD